MKERWVVNKSSRPLSNCELKLPQKGLNFAISPEHIPVHEFITCIEDACKSIGNTQGESDNLRSECVNILKHGKIPPSNVSKNERLAIKSLKDDKNIMILPSDKGTAVVVLDASDYKTKALALLSDTNTNSVEKKDPTNKFAKRLSTILFFLNMKSLFVICFLPFSLDS